MEENQMTEKAANDPKDEADVASAMLQDKEKQIDKRSHETINDTIIKPPVPLWRIILLSGVGFIVEMGYGIEVAYALPLLVASGVKLSHASLILALSPFVGVIIHSPLGVWSDKCGCSWGRRRPFILALMLTMILGCIIAPYSPLISSLGFVGSQAVSVIFTSIGVLMFDLSLGQIQLPFRAYLLDVVPQSQVQQGNFIVTLIGGIGGFFGTSFAAINWSKLLNLQENIVIEAQVFYTLAVVIMIAALICTLFSVKETQTISPQESEHQITDPSSNNCCKVTVACSTLYHTIIESIEFLFYLSKEMWILWFAVLFGFIAHFSVAIYATTFFGEVVYGGNASAPVDSEQYLLYTKGVRVGSWGLAISFILLVICMIVSDKVVKYLGLKAVCLFIQYSFVVAIALLVLPYSVSSVPAALVLISFQGPFIGILLTFPYVLISYYKEKKLMFRKQWNNSSTDAVEGRACFLIDTAHFLGEGIVVLITGPIIELVGTSTAAITIGCISGAVCLLMTRFCKMPDSELFYQIFNNCF